MHSHTRLPASLQEHILIVGYSADPEVQTGQMASQSSIANSSFIHDCISKKRSPQDCYEALGLYREAGGAVKDPVFATVEANDLYKRIKDVANSTKTRYRNDRTSLLADLEKEGIFAEQVKELGQTYGPLLWARPQEPAAQDADNSDGLFWDNEADKDS